jgi:hypothetical protein
MALLLHPKTLNPRANLENILLQAGKPTEVALPALTEELDLPEFGQCQNHPISKPKDRVDTSNHTVSAGGGSDRGGAAGSGREAGPARVRLHAPLHDHAQQAGAQLLLQQPLGGAVSESKLYSSAVRILTLFIWILYLFQKTLAVMPWT